MWRTTAITLLFSSTLWGAFSYQRALTIDHTKVPNTDQIDFPVLVSITDPALKLAANGGHVQNANGYDICFYADAGITPLSWDVEKYDGISGTIVAWVRVPLLSHTGDTVFYVVYGDASITTPRFTATAAWNSGYKGAWHLGNGAALSVNDSTGLNTTANHGATPAAAPINGGAALSTNQYVDAGNASGLQITGAMTVEVWVNLANIPGTNSGNRAAILNKGYNGTSTAYWLDVSGESFANALRFGTYLGGTTHTVQWAKSNLSAGTWYHIAGVYTGSQLLLYVNGAQVASTAYSGGLANTNRDLLFGAQDANGSIVDYLSGSLDEVRISNVGRSGDWISAEYANQSSPNTFVALGAEGSVAAVFTVSNAAVPSNTSTFPVALSGQGTTWSAGTVFSVNGVPGVSLVSQSVANPTSATLTLNTSNNTGQLSVSDGSSTAGVPVASPGLSATWSGPWRYNDAHPGAASHGDTWLMMPTVNGIRVTCNDCFGIGNSNSSNVAFFSESADLTTVTPINGLSGLGGFTGTNVGMCGGTRTVKSSSPISYNGWYILPVRCQGGSGDIHGTLLFSTSGDDGHHWWRAQDSYAVSAGSWTGGVATLTTAPQSLAVGDLIVVSGCNPAAYNTLPGAVSTVTGTDATHVKYAVASDPGAYVSGCVVLGPGAANGSPTGNGWTSAMFEGSMVRPFFAQYTTDNAACCNSIDQNDAYLNGVSIDGTAQNPIVFRVLKSDFDAAPGDISKYQYWTGTGANYSSNAGSAASPKCIVDGVSSPCSAMGAVCWEGISYIQDPALPDGGQYFTISGCTGQQSIWTASHIYGPWTLVNGASTIDDAYNPPVQYGFGNVIPQLYTPISSNPYRATIRVQSDGQWTSDYSIFHHDVTLGQTAYNASRPFNTASAPGVAGNRFHHVQNGLVALWQMRTSGDPNLGGSMTSPLKDDSPTHADINPANANCMGAMMTSVHGLENTNPIFNATWRTCGGAWAVPTGWGMDLDDFSVLFVGKSDLNGTQVAMAGPMSVTGTGFGWYVSGGVMKISIRGGATVDLACPPPSANTFFAYIGVRKGGTTYCFKSTASAATSAGSDSTTLGASWNLRLGSASDQTTNYWRGTIGEIGIWNRALCSYQIPGSCQAGQPDEVEREFNTVRVEGRTRQWGIL